MTTRNDAWMTFEALDVRLKTVLPEQYQDSYEQVQPISMGSASLKFEANGRVAWNEMWRSFCDLAMAGGPPHKGQLLEPGSPSEIEASSEQYRAVYQELRRGIAMVTGLAIEPSTDPGWIRVNCARASLASWLVRAITMENVSVRSEGALLYLPVGPGYRIEKEIKNVITVIAKTLHYWSGHISLQQQHRIANLFARTEIEFPLVQPRRMESGVSPILYRSMAESIHQTTGLLTISEQYNGWLGLTCPNVQTAVWMMRALVASNVLSRREETTLFLPIDLEVDASGRRASTSLAHIYNLAIARMSAASD
jgi:sirohydrochlorin cobaltochelatase